TLNGVEVASFVLGRTLAAFVRQIGAIELHELTLRYQTKVERASCGNERTDLEMTSDILKRFRGVPNTRPQRLNLVGRDQKFSGHSVTGLFSRVCGGFQILQVKGGAAAKPYVREFVSQGEHLSGLVVCPVYENEGRVLVNQNEAAEFVGV